MRIAVLSDIHSNLAALEAVTADLDEADELWILGDIVGYGPEPNEVVTALQRLGARSVMGNHDGAAIGAVDARDFNPDAGRAIAWTADVIDANARAYLSALPEVRCEGELTAVHGSPRDPIWEYVTSAAIAAANFAAFDTAVCFFGHTHVPVIFRQADGRVTAQAVRGGTEYPLEGGRYLLNPGSVGQPRDGDPESAYLVLDTDRATVTFRRVAYPVERTQRRMQEAGLPQRLIERLAVGR
jgi:predicted phosphodiesterase